jgi:hypothetical protein
MSNKSIANPHNFSDFTSNPSRSFTPPFSTFINLSSSFVVSILCHVTTDTVIATSLLMIVDAKRLLTDETSAISCSQVNTAAILDLNLNLNTHFKRMTLHLRLHQVASMSAKNR